MEVFKRFEPLWLVLVVIGGLNWAMVGLFDRNILSDIFGGGTTTDVVYTIVGVGALMLVPALLERMHVDIHLPRTHQS
jgi:uncharacterized membrane protein YuzA (DUF378 family)